MERIVIIDHSSHTLWIEDIDTDELELYYHGEEEEYIKDNYEFKGDWSWDYITDIEYISLKESQPIELRIEKLIK